MNRRSALALLTAALAARPAFAAPQRYVLDTANSTVAFTYTLNGNEMRGRAPVLDSDIIFDVDRPSRSKVSAVINAAKATAGIFFATEAMKGAQVLDTKRFPTIAFQSEKISGTVSKATVLGKMTIRDVTRIETLTAQLFRQAGTEIGDRSRLSILMKGRIDRRLYGADGFPNFVGPFIDLEILSRINRV